MAIIGAGFDDLSLSTEDSYNHVFMDTGTNTVKGMYFQRAQRLRGPEALYCCIDASRQALINVGGIRYTFPWNTLMDFPQSRLSRLSSCTTLREMAEVCDDYDAVRHEFFFDRDPLAFQAIFTFMAKGKLRLLREVCNVALHTELLYWGIDLKQMEPCCHHHMMSAVEDVAEQRCKEDEWREKRRALRTLVTEGSLFHMLGEAVENPHSGLAGKVFAFLSVIMVVVTVVSLCLSTMSDHQQEDVTVCMNHCNTVDSSQNKEY